MVRYKADTLGATAYAVFRADDVDADVPLVVVYGKEAAQDLATAMNWAAEDRERHEGLDFDNSG
jgi:hypothetical protein